VTGARRVLVSGPGGLVNHFIEVRTVHGGVFRGRLLSVQDEWLELERHSCPRSLLVPLAAVTALLDEESPVATARGERGEQDESGHYALGVDEEST
jgi:hypothetical protein